MKRVIFLTLTFALLAAACTNKPANTIVKDNSNTQAPALNTEVKIISFTIEPSRKQDGWLLYTVGSKAALKGTNIANAEVRYLPTGTGMGLEYPDGKLLGQMKMEPGGSYTLALPKGLMTTNFWVVVKGRDGRVIKGQDLENVAEDASK